MRRVSMVIVTPLLCGGLLVTACSSDSTPGTPSGPASTPAASSASPATTQPSPTTSDPATPTTDVAAILDTSITAFTAQDSVHYVLTNDLDGVTTTVEGYATAGGDGYGTGTRTADGDERIVDFKVIGDQVYLNGNEAFWASVVPGGATDLFVGNWVKGPATDEAFSAYPEYTTISAIASQLEPPAGQTLSGATDGSLDGTPAIVLSTDGGSTFYLAAQGEPLPLQLESGNGSLVFDGYGDPVTVEPPPGGDIVDWPGLGQ